MRSTSSPASGREGIRTKVDNVYRHSRHARCGGGFLDFDACDKEKCEGGECTFKGGFLNPCIPDPLQCEE